MMSFAREIFLDFFPTICGSKYVALFAILSALSVLFLLFKWRSGSRKLQFPTFGTPGKFDFRSAMSEGLEKSPEAPFILPFADPTVILPSSCLPHLKNATADVMSTNGSMWKRFAIAWTGSGWVGPELRETVKVELSQELNNLIPMIEDEISPVLRRELGDVKEWISIDIQRILTSAIAQVVGQALLGDELGRDPRWVQASLEHATSCVMFSGKLRTFHPLFRPFVASFLPEMKEVKRTKAVISSLLEPAIKSKVQASRRNKKSTCIAQDDPAPDARIMNWLLQKHYKNTNGRVDSTLLVRDHLTLCFASIHIMSQVATHIVFDLAAYPQYVGTLRAEIDQELGKSPNCKFNTKTVANLTYLDSFCKESARMNPAGIVGFLRMTHRPITLPTNHIIRANTLVAVCNPRFNPAVTDLPNPEEFDGYRFSKLRERDNITAKYQFAGLSEDSIVFGYGIQACPGRLFASTVLKVFTAKFLTDYDVRLEGNSGVRPENMFYDFMIIPPSAGVQIKRR